MFTKITVLFRERERERERVRLRHVYNDIISIGNLLVSWQEFFRGKRKRTDVAEFSLQLLNNIYELHNELVLRTYKHGKYEAFKINDPKPRDIHKATVRDRLVHHAMYRILYAYFDRKFICDSYSCRVSKGTHKAINRFRTYTNKASKNGTKQCFVLKCDIRKFFASIDHSILIQILRKHVEDKDILSLLCNVIDSFHTCNKLCDSRKCYKAKGLPLGNLTSQLLVNVYMNEFDQYVKHKLKVKYYIRYADDFVAMSNSRNELEAMLIQIKEFLNTNLKLELHPNKVHIKTIYSGVDFLGWVNFPKYRVLRTSTKKRMMRNLILKNYKKETVESYKGMLKHGNTHKLMRKVGL